MRKLTIFYGVPISVNNTWDINKAARYFMYYDTIVLGANLQDPEHEEYTSTKEIIRIIKREKARMEIFGYIDIGVTTNDYSLDKIFKMINDWKVLNVDGLLLDNCGFINETPRERLNAVVDYAHDHGLKVMVNSWSIDDVLSDEVEPLYNPKGLKSHITAGDYYLNESFVVNTVAYKDNDGFQDTLDIKIKSERAIRYRVTKGIKIAAIGIIRYHDFLNEKIEFYFKMMETLALIYSYDSYGISDYMYAATSAALKFPKYFEPKCDIYSINPLDEIKINKELTEWNRRTDCHSFLVHIDNSKKEYYYKIE